MSTQVPGVISEENTYVRIHVGVKLSAEQCPKTQEEEEDMSRVPYAIEVGSLMYEMVCTRPDIAHVVGVVELQECSFFHHIPLHFFCPLLISGSNDQ